MFDLHEKIAIVTGAGSGIGRSMARKMATEGATVVGVDLDADRLEQAVAGIVEAALCQTSTLRGNTYGSVRAKNSRALLSCAVLRVSS